MLVTGTAILLLLLIAGCGGEDEASESTTASVCEAVRQEAPQTKLAIRGSVIQLSDLGAAGHPGATSGFVLAGDECSIFVAAADRANVAGLAPETLTVHGAVMTFGSVESERVRRILGVPRGTDSITRGVPHPTPIAPGAPFVDAFSLTGDSAAG